MDVGSYESNPWAGPAFPSVVSVGSADRVLSIAQSTGHITEAERAACYVTSRNPHGTHTAVSVRLIGTLARLSELADQCDQAREAARLMRLETQTADVTSLEQLDVKRALLESLGQHLTAVLDATGVITARLRGEDDTQQAPGLPIAARHQQDFADLFPLLADSLAALPGRLDDLAWLNRHSIPNGAMTSSLKRTEEVLAQYQAYFEAFSALDHLVMGRVAKQKPVKATPPPALSPRPGPGPR